MNTHDSIRIELEATRTAFHELLDQISEDDWHKPSRIPQWTVGQVMFHIVFVMRAIPPEIEAIHRGWPIPAPPPWLFDTLQRWLLPVMAWRKDKQAVAEACESAHRLLLEKLDSIPDDTLEKGRQYPRVEGGPGDESGWVTVERLLRYHPAHFKVHVPDVTSVINSTDQGVTTFKRGPDL